MLRKFIGPVALGLLASLSSAHPFSGAGINTHGQLLPIDKLKAIGIKWVRGDVLPRDVTESRIKAFIRHYQGMPVLWILTQNTPNAPEVAKKLRSWGVTDIEVGNEPDIDIFNPGKRNWSGSEYGRWFASIRRAVGSDARLYGPATSTWKPDFVRAAIEAGMRADGITWHGYWKSIRDVAWISSECQQTFGLPSICSEVGFGSNFGAANYPVKLAPADAFVEMKRSLGSAAWCYYDGPNGNDDKRVGLFEWTGKDWSTVTPTYRRIAAALGVR